MPCIGMGLLSEQRRAGHSTRSLSSGGSGPIVCPEICLCEVLTLNFGASALVRVWSDSTMLETGTRNPPFCELSRRVPAPATD